MARQLIPLLIALFLAGIAHPAQNRIPVMVLPFENKTDNTAFNKIPDWLKSELKNTREIRVIDYYKSTNIGGTLVLMLKPTSTLLESERRITEDTYFVVQGSVTYSDYRYTVHVDVINSSTEWIVARDDVYTMDQAAATMRTVTVRELARRLAKKMTWKEVSPYVEVKPVPADTNLAAVSNTNLVTNRTGTTPANLEKKDILVVYNTNEQVALDRLQNKPLTNAAKPAATNEFPEIPPELLKYTNTFKIQRQETRIQFYTSPYNHQLSLDTVFSSDLFNVLFSTNSGAKSSLFYMNFNLDYKYQIVSNFFLGINTGYGAFIYTSSATNYQIHEFRFLPEFLYRWYFIRPFYADLGLGFGGYGGLISYDSSSTAYNTGLGGFLAQGRVGPGVELGRVFLTVYFIFEYEFLSYADISLAGLDRSLDNNHVIMTLIGASVGVGF